MLAGTLNRDLELRQGLVSLMFWIFGVFRVSESVSR